VLLILGDCFFFEFRDWSVLWRQRCVVSSDGCEDVTDRNCWSIVGAPTIRIIGGSLRACMALALSSRGDNGLRADALIAVANQHLNGYICLYGECCEELADEV
jgi:hypothetical protein